MNSQGSAAMAGQAARRFHLTGRVQGVGMRPSMIRLATQTRVAGYVRNTSDGVELVVEGDFDSVEEFANRLTAQFPEAADVQRVACEEIPPSQLSGFRVYQDALSSQAVSTQVPPDVSVCESCLREVLDPQNGRYGYSFTSCTQCGPRYSITAAMPWERQSGSMSAFPLCESCQAEYESETDRRCHAQTNACPTCGPQLCFHSPDTGDTVSGPRAVEEAAQVVDRGGILALKGIGGYQLVCDATSPALVQRLRGSKQRPGKPLAVMVTTVAQAEEIAVVTDAARRALTSAANPITLMDVHQGGQQLLAAAAVHPHLNQVGVMLPGSPLHFLLSRECERPCVVTSGNVSGEPLMYEDACVERALPAAVDGVLNYNREILRPIDDSVVRVMAGRVVTIRCARGLAPLPLSVETPESILAVGAQQKVSLALSNECQAVLGPHVGDLESLGMRQRFVDQVEQLTELYRTEPTVIVHDLHPDLFTTRWALQQDRRTIAVQHHHAHVVSGMVEQGWLDREVLGVAFDGTGFGTDGTIWGGEFLRCTAADCERVARLRPFFLPGGDRAIREPWRVAVSLLHDTLGVSGARDCLQRLMKTEDGGRTVDAERLLRLLDKQNASRSPGRSLFPRTSSAGRLFDGMAALLLGISSASWEGEPAVRLESVCETQATGAYRPEIVERQLIEVDWRPLLRQAITDVERGVDVGTIAMRFLRGIAESVVEVSCRFTDLPVVLSGGCFQNVLLTEQVERTLSPLQAVGLHRQIPPGDGGLAVGQLAVAAARLQRESQSEDCRSLI